MRRNELIVEITRLSRLLQDAQKRAAAQYVLIDKLTAAGVHVQSLLKRLTSIHRSGRTANEGRKRKAGA